MNNLMDGEQGERKSWRPILEIIQMIGSIASITGISLLWLRGSDPLNYIDIVLAVIGSIFGFGFLTLCVACIYELFKYWARNTSFSFAWRAVYFSLGVPIFVTVVLFFGFNVTVVILAQLEAKLTRQPAQQILQVKYGWPTPSPTP